MESVPLLISQIQQMVRVESIVVYDGFCILLLVE
jgi:hypothetical protein